MVPISDALPREAWDHIRFQASLNQVTRAFNTLGEAALSATEKLAKLPELLVSNSHGKQGL